MDAEGSSGHSILIVDDTPANLEVLLEFMTEAGFEVSVATDGEKALARLEHVHPDLILLDVMMPGIDGPGGGCAATRARPNCWTSSRRPWKRG